MCLDWLRNGVPIRVSDNLWCGPPAWAGRALSLFASSQFSLNLMELRAAERSSSMPFVVERGCHATYAAQAARTRRLREVKLWMRANEELERRPGPCVLSTGLTDSAPT